MPGCQDARMSNVERPNNKRKRKPARLQTSRQSALRRAASAHLASSTALVPVLCCPAPLIAPLAAPLAADHHRRALLQARRNALARRGPQRA
ncbi:hypothetical protein ST47_g5704 [Ascochyta rabiei]|uniref:Uncharacterized protein n=1 Tax=Didymella rabiei TaxID=5454 RepID=A0A163DD70_DIDRA|nr:hypothetical protein ST47_g5704 [Ascochyta rabiei]